VHVMGWAGFCQVCCGGARLITAAAAAERLLAMSSQIDSVTWTYLLAASIAGVCRLLSAALCNKWRTITVELTV
jgi:hypothetical protein